MITLGDQTAMKPPKDSNEVNAETLCENYLRGCNGVTDGTDEKGNLTLCDDCKQGD